MRTFFIVIAAAIAAPANAFGRTASVADRGSDSVAVAETSRALQRPERVPARRGATSRLSGDVDPAPLAPRSFWPSADRAEPRRGAKGFRDRWLLAVEGVTHAPVDAGVQVGVEAPFGLRLFGGVGWVPPLYMRALTNLAASASGDARAKAIFEQADYRGNSWRVQLGIRPFEALGLYVDAGYTSLRLAGGLKLTESGVPELSALGGAYTADTQLHMWLLELGYQAQFAERLVVGLAVGAVGTFDSQTRFSREDGSMPNAVLAEIGKMADASLESYGFLPTLTLRIGFDLL